MHYKKTLGDKVFDVVVYTLTILVLVVTLYPLIFTFSMSISEPRAAATGEVWLLPVGFDPTALKTVLKDPAVGQKYYNTLWYTVVGTVMGILVTSLGAYPLSRPEFSTRSYFMKAITFTMFFSGGLMPTYVVITQYLHLYNTRWAIILPALTSAWYIIVARNFFESLPSDIVESARIDGASEFRIFGQLVLPLSKPILGVLAMYFSVGHWNSWFAHTLYMSDQTKHPMAVYVRNVVLKNGLINNSSEPVASIINPDQILASLQIKYAVVLVTIAPMLLIYPFMSRYLEKGLMVGAVKG